MNTSTKTKINRLGLAGMILAIVLAALAIFNAFVTFDATFGALKNAESSAVDTVEWTVTDTDADGSVINQSEGTDVYLNGSLTDDPELLAQAVRQQRVLQTVQGVTYGIGALASIVAYVFLAFTADAFRRCDSPFEDRVIRRMNVFAWVLFASVLISVLGSVARMYLPDLILGSGRAAVPLLIPSLLSSFAPLVVPLIVLFLVRVFRHGAALQKESDETL